VVAYIYCLYIEQIDRIDISWEDLQH
jgi:hypothetical protein